MAINSNKRRRETSLDGQSGKKQKLKGNSKLELSKILEELMNDRVGCVFSEPVDPVKLGIPDYFSIITKPMDLGKVQRKLERNMYSGADEFADDVRLTFWNAMFYNPTGNKVHRWAKKLDTAFTKKWKLVEANLKCNDGEACYSDGDSDGPGVGINEKNSPNATTPASVEDVQMSAKKASPAAMLKSRFADINCKATHQGHESDPKQVEKRAVRNEAQIKAAEAALRRREQDDLRRRREREREAARMALEKMEKSVEIDDNIDAMKELEMLCCCSPLSDSRDRSPLEQLGLYIKDDCFEVEDAFVDAEEGEILS